MNTAKHAEPNGRTNGSLARQGKVTFLIRLQAGPRGGGIGGAERGNILLFVSNSVTSRGEIRWEVRYYYLFLLWLHAEWTGDAMGKAVGGATNNFFQLGIELFLTHNGFF